MNNVNDLVNKVVAEKNEQNVQDTERRVKALVNTIIESEQTINRAKKAAEAAKAELKELQMPEAIKVEV